VLVDVREMESVNHLFSLSLVFLLAKYGIKFQIIGCGNTAFEKYCHFVKKISSLVWKEKGGRGVMLFEKFQMLEMLAFF
jgi:hypothetical protein